jgi:hypothetical protein
VFLRKFAYIKSGIMKKNFALTLLLVFSFLSCNSLQTTDNQEAKARLISSKVTSLTFTFEATDAQSLLFRQISLSPGYTLKVSKDTLKADLPFYGRAYSAPMNSTDGGIKFTSTDFEHTMVAGKRPGHWKFMFKTHDTKNAVTMYLEIWDNGTAHLTVNDPDRQSMMFQGNI